ncbi:MAG: universal stress protein [Chloroflexi bacterium]|nr:universal stress protein [Chloroflexota bacterium]
MERFSVTNAPNDPQSNAALGQFRAARRRADWEQMWGRLTGKSAQLLAFDEVRAYVKANTPRQRVRKTIPLAAIVGSVGRYQDFTRSFLPKRDSDRSRWASVRRAALDHKPLPPIDVYRLGDVYFVQDGNHRVSVARQMQAEDIDAYVTEIETSVPLQPDDNLDAVIIKAEYAEFLEYTEMARLRPDHQLLVTAPGHYTTLLEMIDVHHYYLSREANGKIPYDEAVVDWYDNVYLPVVDLVQEWGILHSFPGRTETDLYAWIAKHRADISREMGWPVDTGAAAQDLVERFSGRGDKVVTRLAGGLWARLAGLLLPAALDPGPRPGAWRREWLPTHHLRRLFQDVLVAVDGSPQSWHAVEQAGLLVRRDGGDLHGLHIVASEGERTGEPVRAIRTEFERRCRALEIRGDLRVQAAAKRTHPIGHALVQRARWADIVVLPLNHPPRRRPFARINSGIGVLVRRSPRPLLLVPGPATPMQHGLVAYDGSPKAQEALFVATYLAARWKGKLTVVAVMGAGRVADEALGTAYEYTRRRGVAAECIRAEGPVAAALLSTAAEQSADHLILGGYGHAPVVEVVLGSAVDEVLRKTDLPILICR